MSQTKNKLYTRSYAIKRLKEHNFNIDIVNIKYSENDMRYWTVILDPNKNNIFLTCYLNKDNKDDFYFKLQSNSVCISIKTKSMIVLIDGIHKIIEELQII